MSETNEEKLQFIFARLTRKILKHREDEMKNKDRTRKNKEEKNKKEDIARKIGQ